MIRAHTQISRAEMPGCTDQVSNRVRRYFRIEKRGRKKIV
jgi:hypothetical protein